MILITNIHWTTDSHLNMVKTNETIKSQSITETYWNLVRKYITPIFICCLSAICIGIISPTIVRLLGLQSTNVDSTFLMVNEQNHELYKRQASDSTTSKPNTTSNSGLLVDITNPLFFPKFIGNFQLALKSNTSVVVIIGNNYNIYLSAQYLSKTQPSTFALYDLQLTNQSTVAVIQDAVNHRYLHTYNNIQTQGYSRLRTHLETYMPCGSNIMFWMFGNGYLQFYRGGKWAYDTAGCVDPLTGLVKLWIINGQQGLTALKAKYESCGLAPLVPINYT